MALYIKLKVKEEETNIQNRFQSAFKIFNIFRNKIRIKDIETAFFLYDALECLFPTLKYAKYKDNIGILNQYIKKINDLKRKEREYAGFEIRGRIIYKNMSNYFTFYLNPYKHCKKTQNYDIRFELMPNAYLSVFQELEEHIPDFKEILFERINFYNSSKQTNDYFINMSVLAEADEEFDMSKWEFAYFRDAKEILSKLYNSSTEISKSFGLGDRRKFSNYLRSNYMFDNLLEFHLQEQNVEIMEGSIAFKPDDQRSMEKFVFALNKDIYEISKRIFKTKEEVDMEVQKNLKSRGV